jgi:hypothetical protein
MPVYKRLEAGTRALPLHELIATLYDGQSDMVVVLGSPNTIPKGQFGGSECDGLVVRCGWYTLAFRLLLNTEPWRRIRRPVTLPERN